MPTKAAEQYSKDHGADMASNAGSPVNAKSKYAQNLGGQIAKSAVTTTSAKSMAEKARNQRDRGPETLAGGASPTAMPVNPEGGTSPGATMPTVGGTTGPKY